MSQMQCKQAAAYEVFSWQGLMHCSTHEVGILNVIKTIYVCRKRQHSAFTTGEGALRSSGELLRA